MTIGFRFALIYTVSILATSSSFTLNTKTSITACTARKAESGLYYKDVDDSEAIQTETSDNRLSVPIIGPLPRSSPLMVGDEMKLNHPTPLQWRSLEESVITHLERNKGNDGAGTAINGAPIVAIIDEVSGLNSRDTIGREDPFTMKGRYATLAAVVGVRTNSESESISDMSNSGESFMDTVSRIKQLGIEEKLSGSVRLIGIGRAVLGDLFYKVPSEINDVMEEDDEDDEDDDYEYESRGMPIMMANFKILHDVGVRSNKEWKVGEKSRFVSPVHMLSHLNSAKNNAESCHDDRKKLIAGLKAGKARLTNAKLKEDLEDYDGLGMLANIDWDENCDIEAPCEDSINLDMSEIFSMLESKMKFSAEGSYDESQETVASPSQTLSQMENYGVTFYSGFATLTELTDQALSTLDPYYSPKFKNREEYWFEVFGFVAWRALEGFVEPGELAWALKCRSSLVRLERACELLLHHRMLLQELASEVSEELKDCGEECSDLW